VVPELVILVDLVQDLLGRRGLGEELEEGLSSYTICTSRNEDEHSIISKAELPAVNGLLGLLEVHVHGIGGKTFFDLLSQAPSPQEVLYKINKDYKLGYHKAAKLAQIGVWARMMGVTELKDDLLQKINIEPKSDIQSAIDAAIAHVKERGKEPRIILLPAGSLTVPVLEDSQLTGGWMRVRSDVNIEDMMEVLDLVFE